MVIWPSQPNKHQNFGQIRITKIIDDVDPIEYMVKILELVRFPTWFAADLHGFMQTSDGGLKFEFGSRNSGIKFFDEQINDVFIHTGERNMATRKYLQTLTFESLREHWFSSHCDVGFGDESGFSPGRLLAVVMYFEPLCNTVEEIMGTDV